MTDSLKCPEASKVHISYIVGRRRCGKTHFINRVLQDKRIYGEYFSDIILYSQQYEQDKELYKGIITHLYRQTTPKTLRKGFNMLKKINQENKNNATCMVIDNFKSVYDVDIICELTEIMEHCRRHNVHILISSENIKYLHHFDFGVSHLVLSHMKVNAQTRHTLLNKYTLCRQMKQALRKLFDENKSDLHKHLIISFDAYKMCEYDTKTLEIVKHQY